MFIDPVAADYAAELVRLLVQKMSKSVLQITFPLLVVPRWFTYSYTFISLSCNHMVVT